MSKNPMTNVPLKVGVLSCRYSETTSPKTQLARETAVRTARSGDTYQVYGFARAVDFEKKTSLRIDSAEGIDNCAKRAAARPAFGKSVSNWAVRDADKSERSSDNKCQANGCNAQAVQRGNISGLFLCQACRDYEKLKGFSVNSAERAAYLQKKEQEQAQKIDERHEDGLCQAIHCNAKHGKRGQISKLYLCNSCIGYEYTRKLSVNSVEGIEWQAQRNEKRLGH